MFNLSEDNISEIVNKNKNSFNEFYDKTINIFFRYIKSNYFINDHDANDLIADFYLKVWNWLSTYKSFYNFEAWVWTIFKNTLKDYFKKSKEISFSSIDSYETWFNFEEDLVSDENVLELLNTEFEYKTIYNAIQNLDEAFKEVLFLKFIEEKTNKEISKLLKITEELVRQRTSRALKKLKELLKK